MQIAYNYRTTLVVNILKFVFSEATSNIIIHVGLKWVLVLIGNPRWPPMKDIIKN
jgi:hypothetical protein